MSVTAPEIPDMEVDDADIEVGGVMVRERDSLPHGY